MLPSVGAGIIALRVGVFQCFESPRVTMISPKIRLIVPVKGKRSQRALSEGTVNTFSAGSLAFSVGRMFVGHVVLRQLA